MLTVRRVAAVVLAAAAAVLACGQAYADGPGTGAGKCGQWVCVEADSPGTAGGAKPASDGKSGGGGGTGTSRWNCTYNLADPQPAAGSLDWEGHQPGDGAVYEQHCHMDNSTAMVITRMVWAPTPPTAVQIDPAVLAQQAVDKMLLRGPQIGITPKPGGKGVVGMPVYLWTATGAETYGPNTASASAGGVTVTATAKVSKIVWSMGDGQSVTCTTAGTPYQAEFGKQPSPDCGYRYSQPSSTQPSGTYLVTATSTWSIDWTGGGQTGQLTETRTSAVDITVAEVQVLN